MLNLEKVSKVWDDLDKSYENMKLADESKRGFLNRIVGYKGEKGVTAINYIEERLSEEASSYDNEQNTKYLEITEKLRAIGKDFDKADNSSDITSLNQYISRLLNYEKSGLAKVNESFISKIQLRTVPIYSDVLELDLASAYDLTDQFGSCIVNKQGKFQTVNVVDDDAFVFDGSGRSMEDLGTLAATSTLAAYVARYMQGELPKFMREVRKGVMEPDVDETYLFLTYKYYEVSKSRLYLKIGSCKKYVQLKNVNKDDLCYRFTKDIDGITYNVICFLPE